MKNLQQRSLVIVGIVLASGVLVFAAEKFQLPPETAKLKPGPGAEMVTAQCLLCHSADYISTQPRLSRTAWTAAVVKMKDKYGAPIPTNNIPALVDYLSKSYGAEAPK
ncbi:MAG: sorB [Verrucomicrobiales bacterium]|nr:sorB [Verrucomicrobiales bacterium]